MNDDVKTMKEHKCRWIYRSIRIRNKTEASKENSNTVLSLSTLRRRIRYIRSQNTVHFLGATIGASLRQRNADLNSSTWANTLFILQIIGIIEYIHTYISCCFHRWVNSTAYVTSSGHCPHLAFFSATDRRRFTQLIWKIFNFVNGSSENASNQY